MVSFGTKIPSQRTIRIQEVDGSDKELMAVKWQSSRLKAHYPLGGNAILSQENSHRHKRKVCF